MDTLVTMFTCSFSYKNTPYVRFVLGNLVTLLDPPWTFGCPGYSVFLPIPVDSATRFLTAVSFDSNPSWPLKYFSISFQFCRDINMCKKSMAVSSHALWKLLKG